MSSSRPWPVARRSRSSPISTTRTTCCPAIVRRGQMRSPAEAVAEATPEDIAAELAREAAEKAEEDGAAGAGLTLRRAGVEPAHPRITDHHPAAETACRPPDTGATNTHGGHLGGAGQGTA